MKKILISLVIFSFGLMAYSVIQAESTPNQATKIETTMPTDTKQMALATFAGGCFWCMEPPFEKLAGVKSAISGYAGGSKNNAEYRKVASGQTEHLEVIQIEYDPNVVSYATLLDTFWRQIDPTDAGGSFVDRGKHYTSAIFYHDTEQQAQAEASKKALADSGIFKDPIATTVRALDAFYPAEDYHQDYYKENSFRYKVYRNGSGRDQFIKKNWSAHAAVDLTPDTKEKKNNMTTETNKKFTTKTAKTWREFVKPSDKELKASLSPIQYKVTQKDGTERSFTGAYWDNKEKGIYVDVVSGEPLFSSTHKYKSGTGWPSFWDVIEKENVLEKEDNSLFLGKRIELRSKYADSHLGHVFTDGPQPTGLRYCINGASLRFIAATDLEQEGYSEYKALFN